MTDVCLPWDISVYFSAVLQLCPLQALHWDGKSLLLLGQEGCSFDSSPSVRPKKGRFKYFIISPVPLESPETVLPFRETFGNSEISSYVLRSA